MQTASQFARHMEGGSKEKQEPDEYASADDESGTRRGKYDEEMEALDEEGALLKRLIAIRTRKDDLEKRREKDSHGAKKRKARDQSKESTEENEKKEAKLSEGEFSHDSDSDDNDGSETGRRKEEMEKKEVKKE